MKIKTIIKIIVSLVCIIPIVVLIYFESIKKRVFFTYNSNIIMIIILEVINIGITLILFKNKNEISKKYIIFLIIYLLTISLIPCYDITKTFAPTGLQSELMGLALERKYKNIFGITLKWLK